MESSFLLLMLVYFVVFLYFVAGDVLHNHAMFSVNSLYQVCRGCRTFGDELQQCCVCRAD